MSYAETPGMRAYSTDLKERLVRAVAEGQPMREAARRFDVAVTTVKRAVVQQRETGSLERKPIAGRPRAISREQEAALRALPALIGSLAVEVEPVGVNLIAAGFCRHAAVRQAAWRRPRSAPRSAPRRL